MKSEIRLLLGKPNKCTQLLNKFSEGVNVERIPPEGLLFCQMRNYVNLKIRLERICFHDESEKCTKSKCRSSLTVQLEMSAGFHSHMKDPEAIK